MANRIPLLADKVSIFGDENEATMQRLGEDFWIFC